MPPRSSRLWFDNRDASTLSSCPYQLASIFPCLIPVPAGHAGRMRPASRRLLPSLTLSSSLAPPHCQPASDGRRATAARVDKSTNRGRRYLQHDVAEEDNDRHDDRHPSPPPIPVAASEPWHSTLIPLATRSWTTQRLATIPVRLDTTKTRAKLKTHLHACQPRQDRAEVLFRHHDHNMKRTGVRLLSKGGLFTDPDNKVEHCEYPSVIVAAAATHADNVYSDASGRKGFLGFDLVSLHIALIGLVRTPFIKELEDRKRHSNESDGL
ncbi:hypothetical protein K488DRAFT_86797 [Vararia minispora EC-137]|uniref:Uncharacterized protein n=1 Tax=Vararia minispora EC-137 TaxID=1314806 RepID=A0ACB8QIH5_9AGAM|nr:hypothetical protein K488DRAFT_86797 [Vararia minispora EC-137]